MTWLVARLRRPGSERGLAVLVAMIAVTVVGWPLVASAGTGSGERLRPDVRTLGLAHIQVTPDGPGRDLRFTNEVANRGPGVLQVDPGTSEDCDGDGKADNDRTASQRLYRDGDGDGTFDPDLDMAYKSIPAGCMTFHPAHDHWHFNDFARYKLRSNKTGDRVAVSTKVSFCMLDNERVFPQAPGSPSDPGFENCGQDRTMGISVGWSDIYDWSLADQDLDITGLRDGWYCLSSVADPDGRLRETDDSNNGNQVKLRLEGKSVRRSHRPCSTGT